MTKLILVSFADNRYKKSLERLKQQTEGFPFDSRFFHTEKNSFTKEYWKKLKPWFYRRGFGYWNWKFRLVLEYLEKLDNGDLLFFSDAGISWNSSPNALALFDSHISLLDGDNDILVFNQPTIEQEWTKGDILAKCGVYDDDNICKSLQLYSGFFCLKKSKRTLELVKRIVDMSDIDLELVTDKHSLTPNKPGFKENRHDQSLFSVLVKLYPHIEIPYSTNYELDKNGNEIVDCPIQVVRRKEIERPINMVLKNKILWPWRLFLHFYFRNFRDYEYTCDHYPW